MARIRASRAVSPHSGERCRKDTRTARPPTKGLPHYGGTGRRQKWTSAAAGRPPFPAPGASGSGVSASHVLAAAGPAGTSPQHAMRTPGLSSCPSSVGCVCLLLACVLCLKLPTLHVTDEPRVNRVIPCRLLLFLLGPTPTGRCARRPGTPAGQPRSLCPAPTGGVPEKSLRGLRSNKGFEGPFHGPEQSLLMPSPVL